MESGSDEDTQCMSFEDTLVSPPLVERGRSLPIDIHRAAIAAVSAEDEEEEEEEEQVKCECCSLVEECTPAYIAHARDTHCGRWVCGLCAEAVKEEYERGGDVGSMEDALNAHMGMCMQFNKPEQKKRQVADLAAAMTRLLRRSVDGSSSSPRSLPSSPRRGGSTISRASSYLSALPPHQGYKSPL